MSIADNADAATAGEAMEDLLGALRAVEAAIKTLSDRASVLRTIIREEKHVFDQIFPEDEED